MQCHIRVHNFASSIIINMKYAPVPFYYFNEAAGLIVSLTRSLLR